MQRKIRTMVSAEPANAKPTAVPRKGAEQGVASTTANRPSRKLRRAPVVCSPRRAAPPTSKLISNTPKRLSANATSTIAMADTKSGDWNWNPQPTWPPAARTASTAPASTTMEVRIPSA